MGFEQADIRVGTSGYDYTDWKSILYAPELPRKAYLEQYSQAFATLELNYSYYGMPRRENTLNMVNRARPSMDFAIKAHKSLTHEIVPAAMPDGVKEYRDGIGPLAEAGRLAAVLLEFPYSFHYLPDQRRYFDRLLKELTGLPLVVEFRHRDWYNPRVFDGLAQRNISLCLIDLPPNALPAQITFPVTGEMLYLRMHGRNEANWWNGDSVSRYDHLYCPQDLQGWVLKLSKSAENKKIRIYFNNHARGQAVLNARQMQALIAESLAHTGESCPTPHHQT